MLSDAGAAIDSLREKLTPDMKVSSLQSDVNRLNQEINALGPVNMAALEELASAQERKTFLEAQSADLNEAINTLTDAISKIDAETRDLLQGTFDQVNEQSRVVGDHGRWFPGGPQLRSVSLSHARRVQADR